MHKAVPSHFYHLLGCVGISISRREVLDMAEWVPDAVKFGRAAAILSIYLARLDLTGPEEEDNVRAARMHCVDLSR